MFSFLFFRNQYFKLVSVAHHIIFWHLRAKHLGTSNFWGCRSTLHLCSHTRRCVDISACVPFWQTDLFHSSWSSPFTSYCVPLSLHHVFSLKGQLLDFFLFQKAVSVSACCFCAECKSHCAKELRKKKTLKEKGRKLTLFYCRLLLL